ncbi:MAG TPA: terminase family protein [Patescibacteria group bacterium]|nr:terminase family protein [Patescibacteria group bacterium]
MPVSKEDIISSPAEAFRLLSEKIAASAKQPNMYGYKPHLKQQQFHMSLKKRRLYIGGNRSGKTTGGIVEDAWWLTNTHPFLQTPEPPVRGRIISVDFTNGIEKIIKPELARWLPPSQLKGGSWYTAYSNQLRTLTLENGSFVEFMSYDQDLDKFAGTSRHFVHFDEEPPEVIYTENVARLIDTGGSLWITMTPVEGMTWIYDTIYEPGVRGENDIEVITVDMTDNPHLNEGEVQSFLMSLSKDEQEARVHGKFVQLGGLIYKVFDPTPGGLHVLKKKVKPPKDGIWVASLDAGFNNPTAWLWHYIGADGSLLTFQEHYESGKTVEYHAQRVHEINKELGRAPDYYVGDPSIRNTDHITGTSIQQEYIKYGIPITLGNNDVAAGIERVANYMRPRSDGRANWHVTPDCYNLIKELTRYRWKTYANRKSQTQNNPYEQPHKKDDHACDSLRYFVMSRPDLRSEYASLAQQKRDEQNPMGAPVVYPVGHDRDWSLQEGNDGYDNSETQWQFDEFMGGEW